ncbi:G patch domain-containing protein 3 [Alligator mississippiensis]|uniref:G patch domain-containing protein 3 n=1 Tax=Alligator mississippiensis TaxID=8496 RepID=A0A151NK52_ALLMI|nr:G patch domain-containing protein 3 [Alligator mississippiensis]KYO37059.1 G patch domain-containing protein 3 [Alligator mississippiensis]
MAAPSTEGPAQYCLVSRVPAALRSPQLRAYFSQFLEAGGFLCFHYRHRPERAAPAGQGPAPPPPTCCCLVAVRPGQAARLVRMYSGRRWLGPRGEALPGRCLIRRVRVAPDADVDTFTYKTKKELQSKTQSETFTQTDLKWLPELNPPAFMPQGNVGTPLSVFLELIRTCRLPPRVIKKLQLNFPKTGSSRRYGNVPFKYQDTETFAQELVYTAAGDEITEESEPVISSGVSDQTHDDDDDGIGERSGKEKSEESHSDDDDDRCEEWERHEALHEDVTKQERAEERLYEEEIELKWEKGGSGLVFYTDAQYWQEEKGDFDEQTADDWDVDMSIYYDQDGGDKDARDLMQMRLEQRLRDGLEDESIAGQRIGTFEKYTKGIGRKVLERQGWMEGQGLGSSTSGMAEALDNEGQNPRCKRGLGYHGEKLQTFSKAKKPRPDSHILISTVYDEPQPQDTWDELFRCQPPTAMKYRRDMAFVRETHSAQKSPGAS